jgi:ankyrin repeat protein
MLFRLIIASFTPSSQESTNNLDDTLKILIHFRMKRIIFSLLTLIALTAQAQKNTLLEQSFWQSGPDVAAVKAEIAKGNTPFQFNGANYDPAALAINAQAPNASIRYILELPGNNISKLTHDSRNYLHWAAIRGNTELMEYLLAKGVKVNVEDSHGLSVLNYAANGGQQNTRVYDLCLANGADLKKDLSPDGANALLLGIATDKDFALTNYFISKGLSLKSTDAQGNNAFGYATRGGNIDLLKALLQKGVPATGSAMLMAAQGSRRGANPIEVYKYLESVNVKPTFIGKNGENALHSVVRKPKQNEIIQYFLFKGVDVNQADEEGNTVLMNAAAVNREPAAFDLLLPAVKDLNQVNKNGVSALALAVGSNSPEIVSYLIGKGATVNGSDRNGDNLAYYLVQSYNGKNGEDFSAKMKALQAKGFDLTTPQKNGNNLYHLAVAKNDLSLLKMLEGLKLNVNEKNKEGITPLHKAAMISKDDTILKYLLSIGAQKNIVTSFEETAFDLAAENESLSKNNITVNFLK